MTAELVEAEIPITELEKIDVTRVDGVGSPANGIPILLMKATSPMDGADDTAPPNSDEAPCMCKSCGGTGKLTDGSDCTDCDCATAGKSLPDWHADAVELATKAMKRGKVDETPDIDGGMQAIALLGKLIGYEADELAAGHVDEACDIDLLNSAAQMVTAWLSRERANSMADSDAALMQSAADDLEKRNVKTDERKKLAADGNALPDGSYPIANAEDLKNAAVLARSGHGDVPAAKRLIARRAKELGVPNPLDDKGDGDTGKSVATKEATVDDVTQDDGSLIEKAVEAAVTKALQPYEERIKSLGAELAKVKALPAPGGPVMSVTQAPAARGKDTADWITKAARYREIADGISDPVTADSYRQAARQLEDKAATVS